MALTLRTLALAASLCTALPLTVQASVLTLNFENLDSLPTPPMPGSPLNLFNLQPYQSSDHLRFSEGAYAYKWDDDIAGSQGAMIPTPPSGLNFGGGINFELNFDTSDCTPGAVGGAAKGCFNRINMKTTSGGGLISVYDTSSSTLPVLMAVLTGASGGSPGPWSSIFTAAGETTGLINRITFFSPVGVYFDDLEMTYQSAGPGGPGGSLPEPGGLALVALALAGLGLTRRLVAGAAHP